VGRGLGPDAPKKFWQKKARHRTGQESLHEGAVATYFFFLVFFAFAKDLAVGAPLVPGLRIVSLLPAFMRFRFAWIFL